MQLLSLEFRLPVQRTPKRGFLAIAGTKLLPRKELRMSQGGTCRHHRAGQAELPLNPAAPRRDLAGTKPQLLLAPPVYLIHDFVLVTKKLHFDFKSVLLLSILELIFQNTRDFEALSIYNILRFFCQAASLTPQRPHPWAISFYPWPRLSCPSRRHRK